MNPQQIHLDDIPMLAPDRGLVPATIVAAVVVGITRLIQTLSVRNRRFERMIEGDVDRLIDDSALRFKVMARVKISRERVFAHLRGEHILHLGAVKRMYMEANGNFAIVRDEDHHAGLSLLPDWDEEFRERKLIETDILVCRNCGIEQKTHTQTDPSGTHCSNCGAAEWTKAVIER